jgi:hypothetical protein
MEQEIDAELREHMAMCVDDNMVQGMSREAAEALRFLVEGRPFGRVVLTVSQSDNHWPGEDSRAR